MDAKSKKKNICCTYIHRFLFISSLQNPIISHLSQKAFLIRKFWAKTNFSKLETSKGNPLSVPSLGPRFSSDFTGNTGDPPKKTVKKRHHHGVYQPGNPWKTPKKYPKIVSPSHGVNSKQLTGATDPSEKSILQIFLANSRRHFQTGFPGSKNPSIHSWENEKNDGNLSWKKPPKKPTMENFWNLWMSNQIQKEVEVFPRIPTRFFLRIHVGLSGETGHQLKHASKSWFFTSLASYLSMFECHLKTKKINLNILQLLSCF